jgi:hypothetical protein
MVDDEITGVASDGVLDDVMDERVNEVAEG